MIYRLELVILAIVFVAVGIILGYVPQIPEFASTIFYILAVIVLVIWAILLIVDHVPRSRS